MAAARSKALGPRVERLEGQVDDLAGRIDRLEVETGLRPPPAPEPPPAEAPLRCPGCRLPVEEPVGRRCEWCGFLFTVARPRRDPT